MTENNLDKASGKLADQFLAQQMMANLAATHPEGIKPAKELSKLRLFAPASPLDIKGEQTEKISDDVYKITMYALSIKGEFYSTEGSGRLTEFFCDAIMFATVSAADQYRKYYDNVNQVDESQLLEVVATVTRL